MNRRRAERAAALALALVLGSGSAGADRRPDGRWPVADPIAARAMLDRLVGHHVGWHDGTLTISDVASAGPPWIGIVERRGATRWLVGPGFAWPLIGPLARARIAGPGYLVWIVGAIDRDQLRVRRLGVLAPPR